MCYMQGFLCQSAEADEGTHRLGLVSIAVSDLSTELSMATPSEVKAYVR